MNNLRCKEAAQFLCISLSKLMKLCHQKQIRYYKVGRINVFRLEDLNHYLEINKVLTVDELKDSAENKVLKIKSTQNVKRF